MIVQDHQEQLEPIFGETVTSQNFHVRIVSIGDITLAREYPAPLTLTECCHR